MGSYCIIINAILQYQAFELMLSQLNALPALFFFSLLLHVIKRDIKCSISSCREPKSLIISSLCASMCWKYKYMSLDVYIFTPIMSNNHSTT